MKKLLNLTKEQYKTIKANNGNASIVTRDNQQLTIVNYQVQGGETFKNDIRVIDPLETKSLILTHDESKELKTKDYIIVRKWGHDFKILKDLTIYQLNDYNENTILIYNGDYIY